MLLWSFFSLSLVRVLSRTIAVDFLHVKTKTLRMVECLVAVIAGHWRGGMDEAMLSAIGRAGKSRVTSGFRTSVGSLAGVLSSMDLEILCSGEAHVAKVALEGLEAGVKLGVDGKLVFRLERSFS